MVGDDPGALNKWIGRNAKRFVTEIADLLPHLLHLAHAPASAGAAAAAAVEDAGDMLDAECDVSGALDDDDIDAAWEADDDEVAAEVAREPLMMQDAQDFENFHILAVFAMRPFDPERGDTDNYRQERAFEYFEAALPVVKALLRDTPEAHTVLGSVMLKVRTQRSLSKTPHPPPKKSPSSHTKRKRYFPPLYRRPTMSC